MVRMSCFPTTLTWLLSCGAICIAAASSSAQQGNDASDLDGTESIRLQLLHHWRGQRSAVINARFRFRMIRTSRVRDLEREEVEQVIRSVDLAANPDELRSLYDHLCSDRISGAPWGTGELVVEDGKSIETIRLGSQLDELVHTNAFDGKSHVVQGLRGESKDASVFEGAASIGRLKLEDMRFVPPDDSDLLATYEIVELSADRLRAVHGQDSFIADPQTGFIHFAVAEVGSDRSEYHQYGPMECGNGALFPSASIRLRYSMNRLQRLTAMTIDNVQLNQDLEPNAFAVSSPAETTVFDHRGESTGPPHVFKTPHIVGDVAQFAADQPRTGRQAAAAYGRALSVRALFLSLAFIFLVIVAYITARRSCNNKFKSG